MQRKKPSGVARLQPALRVSSPEDAAEREAEVTARRVVRMPVPESSIRNQSGTFRSPYVRPLPHTLQRKAEGMPDTGANIAAEIQSSTTEGTPLPLSVRRFMEPRFGADFRQVRMHTTERAATLSNRLGARAFAVGNQIFFGRDQFRPDNMEGRELIAHELTHTIQQGAAIQRSEDVSIRQHAPTMVQRLGISDALDYFAERAHAIPGFRMFTIILGVNPINMSRVERSPANILRGVIEFVPGGALITQALDNYGIIDRVANWVEQQIRSLGMTGSIIRDAVMRFLDSLSWRDIFRLGSVWDRAKRIFSEPIDRIISFARGLVTGILGFIREALLRPLARLAEGTRGYDLLKAVLGQDPITGDPYPRNADTLIGGFMRLIGQEEIWENIKRANAVARAWAWFQGALSGLLGFVRQIPTLFVRALQSLTVGDVVLLPRAFARVAGVFGDLAVRFISWAGSQVMSLLQIIFEVVAPGAMVYIRRAAGAFQTIIRNPIAFVGNLVRAGILGFRQFAGNFLTHLRTSLIGWLTGTLSGLDIYIPQAFNLREIIKFVLSVLGLTWQNIRQKFVRHIGETAVAALETTFDIVVTLVREGPAAAWEKIQEQITNLREMVMEQIMTFVRDRVVQAAITRLLTSLNPAGAFIQAILAIYNTVMFFVERLRQIAQVAAAFIDSIAAIASGVLTAAANRVEQTMAGLLTLVISFLARIAGLGRVSDAITNIVNRIRAPIDRALDRVVEWIVNMARRLGRLIAGAARRAGSAVARWLGIRKVIRLRNQIEHTIYFAQSGERATLMIATNPIEFRRFLNTIRPLSPEMQDERTTAIRLVDSIAQLEAQTATTNVDHSDRIQLLVEELGRITIELLNSSVNYDMRTTPPVFAGRSRGGFGAGMRVMLALNDIGGGTEPNVPVIPAWDILRRRRAGSTPYYRLGHLLSERLGGRGDTWDNITPLSISANLAHFRRAEGILIPRPGDRPTGILYVVTPSYGRPINTALITAIQHHSNPDPAPVKQLKEEIVRNEQFVAVSMVCSMSEVDYESGEQIGISQTYTIPNEIDQSSPASYQV